jgi:hypothetical protein
MSASSWHWYGGTTWSNDFWVYNYEHGLIPAFWVLEIVITSITTRFPSIRRQFDVKRTENLSSSLVSWYSFLFVLFPTISFMILHPLPVWISASVCIYVFILDT